MNDATTRPKVLLVGHGQLNQGLEESLAHQVEFHSISRSSRARSPHWAVDLTREAPEGIRDFAYDAVVFALSPPEFSETAYQDTYVKGVRQVLSVLNLQTRPTLFFVSSSSVYGQHEGEWVDESSETRPTGFSGQALLEAEALLREQEAPTCVLRVSGIYGGQRTRLIEQVQRGDFKTESESYYSNRVHETDVIRAMTHLLTRVLGKQPVDDCYLVSDGQPCLQKEVLGWLADEIGVRPRTDSGSQTNASRKPRRRVGSKRLSSQRLRQSGFTFRYPTFREGYGEMLDRLGLRKRP